ncbi:MAG: hydrogenase maturation nickel metallochaperone HypA [Cyanomargarita calcarea GSE-NOS-MK-12-04C]|jgi:hydrogenase nickel incorporation protein HypA/HybF|uniref:Hydrogenase maturation factor HypA n=1 Tax=Cyanomargarita calcarea GSE-NOS-MK-12-04C TaxID=2839659 RepID=A0A951QIJ6_9CYAN|nr:hydrogenase maturation nickel metallochaperone HypA [Cyanomargarita calcarea GSE-NOS-MK-12-04C]
MHEIGLMQNILDTAVERAEQEGAHRIYMVEMRVGRAFGVAPKSLEMAFDVVKKGTIAEMAKLQVDYVPTVCYCSNCKIEFQPTDLLYECPECHQAYCEVRQGKEFELASLDVS